MPGKPSFLSAILSSIFERGRAHSRRGDPRKTGAVGPAVDLPALCARLIAGEGEASSVAMATEILARWAGLDTAGQRDFLLALAANFGPDPARLDQAIETYRARPDAETVMALHHAAEPPRQEVLRRLNLAPLGTLTLVRMRETGLRYLREHPALKALDADFTHLFSSWFNRGFLVLRRIDWATQANILEKIIRYEAVHAIQDWDDLRRRLQPGDRRCFAFFHPALVDEPLIFVEVALSDEPLSSIAELLAEDRAPDTGAHAKTAVFYSISNCQAGLRGISFGDFLIKQVVDELRRELPEIETFVTLSPIPGFAAWLDDQIGEEGGLLAADDKTALSRLHGGDWLHDADLAEAVRPQLMRAGAAYLLRAKTPTGKPLDPVARFHLNNGASVHRLNFRADTSPRGLKEAHGLMVNYCYKLDEIEANHERLARDGHVAASLDVQRLAAPAAPAAAGRLQARRRKRFL